MKDKDLDKELENVEVQNVEQPAEEQKEGMKVSQKMLYMLFAIASFAIIVLTKIFLNFGAYQPIFHGIICLIVYSLSGAGAVLSFLQEKKPNAEFYANGSALILALLCL